MFFRGARGQDVLVPMLVLSGWYRGQGAGDITQGHSQWLTDTNYGFNLLLLLSLTPLHLAADISTCDILTVSLKSLSCLHFFLIPFSTCLCASLSVSLFCTCTSSMQRLNIQHLYYESIPVILFSPLARIRSSSPRSLPPHSPYQRKLCPDALCFQCFAVCVCQISWIWFFEKPSVNFKCPLRVKDKLIRLWLSEVSVTSSKTFHIQKGQRSTSLFNTIIQELKGRLWPCFTFCQMLKWWH